MGYYYDGTANQTLIEQWNGRTWKVQLSPSPGRANWSELDGVAAVSSRNAWAAGACGNSLGADPA